MVRALVLAFHANFNFDCYFNQAVAPTVAQMLRNTVNQIEKSSHTALIL